MSDWRCHPGEEAAYCDCQTWPQRWAIYRRDLRRIREREYVRVYHEVPDIQWQSDFVTLRVRQEAERLRQERAFEIAQRVAERRQQRESKDRPLAEIVAERIAQRIQAAPIERNTQHG